MGLLHAVPMHRRLNSTAAAGPRAGRTRSVVGLEGRTLGLGLRDGAGEWHVLGRRADFLALGLGDVDLGDVGDVGGVLGDNDGVGDGLADGGLVGNLLDVGRVGGDGLGLGDLLVQGLDVFGGLLLDLGLRAGLGDLGFDLLGLGDWDVDGLGRVLYGLGLAAGGGDELLEVAGGLWLLVVVIITGEGRDEGCRGEKSEPV